MADIRARIDEYLNSPGLAANIDAMFTDPTCLGWGATHASPQLLDVKAPVNQRISALPIARMGAIPVYRVEWPGDRLPTMTQRRAMHRALTPVAIEHLICYVTSDARQAAFIWARNRGRGTGKGQNTELRTLPFEVGSPARTTIDQLAELAFTSQDLGLFGEPPAGMVLDKLNAAFDVEAVTKAFYQGYRAIFEGLRKRLVSKTGDGRWSHDFALQLLNRIMFLYFVQRKRWLGGDVDFSRTLWQAYRRSGRPANTFYRDWLSVLFFEAFARAFKPGRADRAYMPESIRHALASAPYLNGGLFRKNDLDKVPNVVIDDKVFEELFDRFEGSAPGHFERYNFTITESTPLDQEVAVDPEMIGKVYESLVHVSEEASEQGEAGIFYTPRVEIDLMCRLSLVDWLTNHLGPRHKDRLYEAVFAFDLEDKEAADRHLAQENLWPQVRELLEHVAVVDPACGSGSFLVGMLQVLSDLLGRAADQLGEPDNAYARKKAIIANSLYGVDVMDWAVHVAELRLWLQLIIDVELEDIAQPQEPLLPHLSFNIRPGDSLVQEVGGEDLSLRDNGRLPPALRHRIAQLEQAKRSFFYGAPGGQADERQLKQDELALFRAILDYQIVRQKGIVREATERVLPATDVFGNDASDLQTRGKSLQQLEVEQEQLARLEREYAAIRSVDDLPFVWDIAFVEVFEGSKSGFDIVVGNPPYVRHESIHDPRQSQAEASAADKRQYKAKLQHAVYTTWPETFGYDWGSDKASWKLDARSDLYIYFYFHGLHLLNSKGAFCFITSNAWLDVGYGSTLQEFLLTRAAVKLVIDNQERRSFERADVNTVIVLLGAPQDARRPLPESLNHTARFVMVTVPFEETLNPVIWEEVEAATVRTTRQEYRVHPAPQSALLSAGMNPERRRYDGDKWGGRYLRAPDIYWTIMEKSKDKLVRLGDIADVRRGITTGANEFFYLDEEKIARWGIEEEFLVPFLFSLKEIDRYEVENSSLRRKLFVCRYEKGRLRQMHKHGALEYISHGEALRIHERPTVSNRSPWYALPEQKYPEFVSNRFLGERFGFPWSERTLVGDVFFVGYFHDQAPLYISLMNSMLSFLSAEVQARKTYGIGVAYLYGPEINGLELVNPEALSQNHRDSLITTFNRMKGRSILKISEEVLQQDRLALDSIVCEALGLTTGERDGMYEALVDLVCARINKGKSTSLERCVHRSRPNAGAARR